MSNVVVHDEDEIPMAADENDHPYNGSRLDLVPNANGFKLTGIDPRGIAGDGLEVVVVNASPTFTVSIANNSAGSALENRIYTADGSDILLSPLGTPGGTAMVWMVRIETEAGFVGWWAQP